MFSFTRQIVPSLHKPLQGLDTLVRGICSNGLGHQNILNTPTGLSSRLQNSILASQQSPVLKGSAQNKVEQHSVRSYMRIYYKPSAWKRYNKHNIEKRLSTPAGIDVLWRRVLKGRHNLAVYERILPNTVDAKILARHQMRFSKHPLTQRKLPKPGLF